MYIVIQNEFIRDTYKAVKIQYDNYKKLEVVEFIEYMGQMFSK